MNQPERKCHVTDSVVSKVTESCVICLFIHYLLCLFPNIKMFMKVLVKVHVLFNFFKRVGWFF